MPLNTSSYSSWQHPNPNIAEYSVGWGVLKQQIVPHNVPAAEAGQGPPAYFYALQFFFLNGDGGYIGLQVDSGGLRAIYSIWSALGATAGAGGTASAFSGEGNGYHVLLPYTWVANHVYELEVRRVLTTNPAPHQYEAYVTDVNTGVRTLIGAITMPNTWGQISNYAPNFVEWYPWSEVRACEAFPYSSVSLRSPRLEPLPGQSGPAAGYLVEIAPDQFGGNCGFSSVTAETSGGLASKLHRNGYDVPNPPANPPVLTSMSIDDDTLTLVYNQTLNPAKVPTTSGIAISVNGEPEIPNLGASVVANTVLVTFGAVGATDVVTASYYSTFLPTANRIQNPAGNFAAGFLSNAVSNITGGTPTPPPAIPENPASASVELEVRSPSGVLRSRLRRSKGRQWQDTRNDLGTGSLIVNLTDPDSANIATGDIVICTVNGVFAASTVAGSTTVTSAGAAFVDTDVGKQVQMRGVAEGAMIVSRLGTDETVRSQNVQLSAAAGETLTNARMSIVGRHDAYAWVVEDDDEITISPDEEKGQVRTLSGRGRGADLDHALVFPEPLNRGDSRAFDFTSNNYFKSVSDDVFTFLGGHPLGTAPNQVAWAVDPRNRLGYSSGLDDGGNHLTPWWPGPPEGWPSTGPFQFAEWLWPFRIGANPGEGFYRYIHHPNPSDTGHYRLFYTADDFVELFIDGERLASTQEPQMFYRTFSVDFDMTAGDHVISAHVRNTGGPGGLLVELWQMANDGTLDTQRAVSKAASWAVAGDVAGAPAPGMTAGHIMQILMAEARERGELVGNRTVPMGFSATRDSYGSYWGQLINPTLAIGQSYLQVLAIFADLGIDWWVEPRTGMLRMAAQPRGIGRVATFTKGVNLKTLQHRRNTESLVNALLGRVDLDDFQKTGWVTATDDTSASVYGRREAFVSAAAQPSAQWDRLAEATLEEFATPADTATLEVAVRQDISGWQRAVPYADYSVGDWVTLPGRAGTGAKSFRLRAISVSEDDDGVLSVTPELGSLTAELTERVMRWLATMVPGTLGGALATGAIPTAIGQLRIPT